MTYIIMHYHKGMYRPACFAFTSIDSAKHYAELTGYQNYYIETLMPVS